METINEWRLTEYYRDRVDEELIELARDFDGPTDVARGVLRDELKRRGLPQPEDFVSSPPEKAGTPFWKHPAADAEIPVHTKAIGEGPHDYSLRMQ